MPHGAASRRWYRLRRRWALCVGYADTLLAILRERMAIHGCPEDADFTACAERAAWTAAALTPPREGRRATFWRIHVSIVAALNAFNSGLARENERLRLELAELRRQLDPPRSQFIVHLASPHNVHPLPCARRHQLRRRSP